MIGIASDHIGFELKKQLSGFILSSGETVKDFGPISAERTDYPVYAKEVTQAILSGQIEAGILICGTGVGMSLAANKEKGIRAVVCSEPYSAIMAKKHNNTNVLALGARVVGKDLAELIVSSWLDAEFEGGRHRDRIAMLEK